MYKRGLLCCRLTLNRAMREASRRRTATIQIPALFLSTQNANEGMTAARQIMRYIPLPFPSKTSSVAHYTSLNCLDSILRKDNVVMWATRYGYFEDETEYVLAMDAIKPHIEGIANEIKADYDPEHAFFPYILSFSNSLDSEYLWKHFGCEVMLIFDRMLLFSYCHHYTESEHKLTMCHDVNYSESEDIHPIIAKTYNELQKEFADNPIEMLYEVPAFIKDKKRFQNENEFRLVRGFNDMFSFSTSTETFKDCEEPPAALKFRINKANKLTPYIEILLPKQALVGLCLNNTIKEENIDAVRLMLTARNYDIGIFNSVIQHI